MDLPILRCKYQERYIGFPSQRVWGSSITPLNERGAHTCIVCNNIISVPQHSLLTIARISDDKRKTEYPMCTILEVGRASPPVRERYKFNPVYGSSNRASFSGHYQVPRKDLIRLYDEMVLNW